MPPWLQTLLALTIVAACVAYVLWQAYRALLGKGSRIGSCCSTGCKPQKPPGESRTNGAIAYIPASQLYRKRPK